MFIKLKTLGNSQLRIFCTQSYSIELFYILLSNKKNNFGVDEIFNNLSLPKPKKSTVDSFIKFLITKGFVESLQNNDKRKKTLILSNKSIIEYKKLNF